MLGESFDLVDRGDLMLAVRARELMNEIRLLLRQHLDRAEWTDLRHSE